MNSDFKTGLIVMVFALLYLVVFAAFVVFPAFAAHVLYNIITTCGERLDWVARTVLIICIADMLIHGVTNFVKLIKSVGEGARKMQ